VTRNGKPINILNVVSARLSDGRRRSDTVADRQRALQCDGARIGVNWYGPLGYGYRRCGMVCGGGPKSRGPITRSYWTACSFSQACDVRRVIEPNGAFIERPELDEHLRWPISGSAATGARAGKTRNRAVVGGQSQQRAYRVRPGPDGPNLVVVEDGTFGDRYPILLLVRCGYLVATPSVIERASSDHKGRRHSGLLPATDEADHRNVHCPPSCDTISDPVSCTASAIAEQPFKRAVNLALGGGRSVIWVDG
jgi:hypothetical protein